ncbi:hypothetical protein [Acinetobacter sp. A47]|uniref:hypothetical protein n=1 Tax=Acinetobacter sp. A47 TaxID=1561217 RepID=UPI00068A86C4|nr:hypothetical protein [Acinetobacter sp. A47]
MKNFKQQWLLELSVDELDSWMQRIEDDCLETVRLNTPKVIDYSEPYPYLEREVMEYTYEDFLEARNILVSQAA